MSYTPKRKTPQSYSQSQLERRRKGLCLHCDQPVVPHKRMCRAHLDAARQSYHKRWTGMTPLDKCHARFQAIGAAKKASGHTWTITKEDLAWPTHCPVLGWELDYTGTDHQRGWSIDKFDPALGYVPGNVTIISRLANTIKSNATIEQVEQVAAWMRKKHATS